MRTAWLTSQGFPLFVNNLVQSTFILIACIAILGLMRNRPAAHRHFVVTTALLLLLLLPLSSVLSVRERKSRPHAFAQGSHPGMVFASNRRDVRPEMPASNEVPSKGSVFASSDPGNLAVGQQVANKVPAFAFVSPELWAKLGMILLAIWFCGTVLFLARLSVALVGLRRLAPQSPGLANPALCQQTEAILQGAGYRAPVRILQSSADLSASVPVTWGLFRPALLLPGEATEWPADKLRVVVLHEVAHMRRADWMTQILALLVCSVYWFHPLVWFCYRRMQIEAERACDDIVLMSGVSATEYANHLLEMVRALHTVRNARYAAVSMAHRSFVGERVQSILARGSQRGSITRTGLLIAVPIAGAVLLLATCLRPLEARGDQEAAIQPAPRASFAAPTPPGPSGIVVMLENGIQVELIGVGTSDDGVTPTPQDWWRPDGTRLSEPPTQGSNRFHKSYPYCGGHGMAHALFFRLHSTEDTDASTTGYVVDPTRHLDTDMWRHGRDLRLNDAHLTPQIPATGSLVLPFPKEETHCTYRFGIATGPWQTVAVTKLTAHGAGGGHITLTQRPTLSCGYIAKPSRELSLVGTHSPLGDVARRVVAFDAAGNEVPLEEGGADSHGDGNVQVSPSAMARIAELRLQVRPYQWADFANIRLAPLGPTQTTVAVPPSLTGFRHTYACGLTVSLSCLTERAAEGGKWWRPDGEALSGPVQEYKRFAGFQGWPAQSRPRNVFVQHEASRNLEWNEAWEFLPQNQAYAGIRHYSGEFTATHKQPVMSSMVVNYPAETRRCSLRLGVATGRWQTLASVAMPVDIKPQPDEPNAYDGDLALLLADRPQLRYHTRSGEVRRLLFLDDGRTVGNRARRIVAVDKQGHEHVLFVTGNGTFDHDFPSIPPYDFISLTFQDGGVVRRYNSLDLSTIRVFRLETRPYEWAEFKGIKLDPAL